MLEKMKRKKPSGIDVENNYCIRLNDLEITVSFAIWLPRRVEDLNGRLELLNDIIQFGFRIKIIDDER